MDIYLFFFFQEQNKLDRSTIVLSFLRFRGNIKIISEANQASFLRALKS